MLKRDEFTHRIMDIIINDPEMIPAFKPKYITDEMWEYCIDKDPSIFIYCKCPSARICFKVLSIDGFYLENIDPTNYSEEIYRKMCRIAIETTPKAYPLIPKEFRNDKLKAVAYSRDPELLLSEKKLTPNMVEEIVLHNPSLIQYVENPPDDLIIKVLDKQPKAIVYFSSLSDKVKEWYDENYPEYASMFFMD